MTCFSACVSYVLISVAAYYFYGGSYFRECRQVGTQSQVFAFFMTGAYIIVAELTSMTLYLYYNKDEGEMERQRKDD